MDFTTASFLTMHEIYATMIDPCSVDIVYNLNSTTMKLKAVYFLGSNRII